jgi:hypothetical protein
MLAVQNPTDFLSKDIAAICQGGANKEIGFHPCPFLE